jgi:hypothetical protein
MIFTALTGLFNLIDVFIWLQYTLYSLRDMRLNNIPSNIEALIPNPSPEGRREPDSKSLSPRERDLG